MHTEALESLEGYGHACGPHKSLSSSLSVYSPTGCKSVKARVDIPVALKVGPYFSSFSHLAHRPGKGSQAADALVLFNRFHRLDVDVNSLKVVAGNPYSSQEEIHTSLRWILLLVGKIDLT